MTSAVCTATQIASSVAKLQLREKLWPAIGVSCVALTENLVSSIAVSQKRAHAYRAPYKPIKEGVGTLLSVAAFNHERASMSCLQQLNALKANNRTKNTYNGATSGFEVKVWQHTTLRTALCMSLWACSVPRISYVHLRKAALYNEVSYLRYAWRLWLCFSNSTSTLHYAPINGMPCIQHLGLDGG